MYKVFMAWKYLSSQKITLFCIASVCVGIMVLTVVSSVMSGFSRDMKKLMRGMQSDLVIYRSNIDPWMEEYDKILTALKQEPLVRGASPRIEYPAWMKWGSAKRDVLLVGIDPKNELVASDMQKYFYQGGKKAFDFQYDDGKSPASGGMVVGKDEKTSSLQGEVVGITCLKGSGIPRGEYEIVGFFNSGLYDYDSRSVFVHIKSAQEMLNVSPKPYANRIAISVQDYAKNRDQAIKKVADICHSVTECSNSESHNYGICGSFIIRTWEEFREPLIKAAELQRDIQVMILFFIIIVAIFNMSAIYTLIVRAKTKDIGILKALGATKSGIASIFLFSTVFCCVIGAACGVIGGALIADNLNEIAKFVKGTSRNINNMKFSTPLHWFIQNFYLISIVGFVLLTVAIFFFIRSRKKFFTTIFFIITPVFVGSSLFTHSIISDPSKDPAWQGYDFFPKSIYFLENIPSEIHYPTVLMYVIASFAVCIIFSIYPAVKAAHLDPVEAIRRE